MIKIEVVSTSKSAMEVIAHGDIKGRDNAVHQMFAVLTALDRMDDEVLCDAFELFLKNKIKEKTDDDESKS